MPYYRPTPQENRIKRIDNTNKKKPKLYVYVHRKIMTQSTETNYDIEWKLLDYLLSQSERLQNKPDLILQEIDNFAKDPEHHRMVSNLGPFKTKQIIDQIHEQDPEVIVQFGTHGAYSCILAASELRKINGDNSTCKVFTFEVDPVYVSISSQIIKLSGLQDFIIAVSGKSGTRIQQLAQKHEIERIDLLLLDQWGDCYLPDLRVVETLSLITEGTVIIADNVLDGGVADYLEYVRSPPIFKREYNFRVKNVNGFFFLGKWGLLYETETLTDNTEKGVREQIEITKCVGLLDG
jgi:catechol O-methyltransferase